MSMMTGDYQPPSMPANRDAIRELVEQVSTQWVDLYNNNLQLTVQAVQALHHAFDRRFIRPRGTP